MDEFELIQILWQNPATSRQDVVVGIGDDAAIVAPNPHLQLAITMDSCIEGVHFFPSLAPAVVARRALMRTISDLAAMGAQPVWLTQSLTVPNNDIHWLQQYREALLSLTRQFQMQLIGGDMSHGARAIHLTAFGYLPIGKGLLRSHAEVGDLIVVSGALGGASAYLHHRAPELQHYYDAPTARIELGMALLNVAHACIDISDGLAQDLNHLLTASQVGATLQLTAIPCAPQASLQDALQGGDDYELCFTIAAKHRNELTRLTNQLGIALTVIGEIEQSRGLRGIDANQQLINIPIEGYRHHFENN